MARTVSKAGYGTQLWDVRRLQVELYAAWPQAVPDEVWGREVLEYDLPLTALNTCLDGELILGTDPGRLPAGFSLAGLPGQPVACNLGPGSRLVQVVAVLPNMDEVVVYTGLLGLARPLEGRRWAVPLIEPAEMGLPNFIYNTYPPPNDIYGFPVPLTTAQTIPTAAPLAPATSARLYGVAYPNRYTHSALLTYREYWQSVLEGEPDATFGAGPDLVFAAGKPGSVPGGQRPTYTVDGRALGLRGEGRSIGDYLTRVRQWVEGTPEYSPPMQNLTSARTLPPFLPPRTAGVGGQIVTSIQEGSSFLPAYGGGSVNASGVDISNQNIQVTIPPRGFGVRLQGVSVVLRINVSVITGPGAFYLIAQAHTPGGGFTDIGEAHPPIARAGAWVIKIEPTVDKLADVDYITIIAGVEGLDAGSSISGDVTVVSAGDNREVTTYSATYEPTPPGLNAAIVTDEAYTFRLRGLHSGLQVLGLPGGARSATTRMRSTPKGPVTEVRAGPLPSPGSPAAIINGQSAWIRGFGGRR